MKSKIEEMMSSIPFDNKGLNVDTQILRIGIISEMDAISLYEQLANAATDERLKKTLLDIASEEKTHVGEFESLLKELDPEFEKELESGDKEVDLSSESEDEDSNDKDDMKEAKERLYGKSAIDQLNEMKIVFGKLIK